MTDRVQDNCSHEGVPCIHCGQGSWSPPASSNRVCLVRSPSGATECMRDAGHEWPHRDFWGKEWPRDPIPNSAAEQAAWHRSQVNHHATEAERLQREADATPHRMEDEHT